jgi:protein TonB
MSGDSKPWRPSLLQWCLLISVGLHGVLLSLRFIDPEAFNRVFEDTPLEVVLVNARSDEKPIKSQAIAQASLAGGGDADTGRATSPLPPSAYTLPGESLDEAQRQIQQMQVQQQQMLANLRRELARMPPPQRTSQPLSSADIEREERRRQMLRTLAEIEKRVNEENARPKKRYISPATREEVYAIYYDSLRRKIENRGTRDFPVSGGKKLYGELTMNITVDAEGRVIDADIVKGSGSKQLNSRAVAIVFAAGPFGRFTNDMKRQADQIVVTSRFRFTRTDGLEATAEASARP